MTRSFAEGWAEKRAQKIYFFQQTQPEADGFWLLVIGTMKSPTIGSFLRPLRM
jgi:hypothetical protein